MTCTLRALLAALCLLLPVAAFGQGAVLQSGPHAPGHIPQYVGAGSQAVIMDGGGAAGGRAGVNPSEFGLTARGTGTPPYVGQGKGPFGSNWCDYDAPIDNATGYHFLCLSPNSAGGGGLIAYGAGGSASPLSLSFNINGTTYQFPFAISGIVGPPTTTINAIAVWNNGVGTLLRNSTPTINAIGALNVPDDTSTVNPRISVGSGGSVNSQNAGYADSRFISVTGTSMHAFADNKNVDAAGGYGMNSFDSRFNVIGSQNYDHIISFQAIFNYGSSGTIQTLEGFIYHPTISAGHANSSYGALIFDPTMAGGATLDFNYGIYIDAKTAGGTLNRAIFTAGATISEFTGPVYGDTEIRVQNAVPVFRMSTALGVTLGSLFSDGSSVHLLNTNPTSTYLGTNGTDVVEVQTTVNRPVNSGAVNLGDINHRWLSLVSQTGSLNNNAVALPAIGTFAPVLQMGQADAVQTLATLQSFNSGVTLQAGLAYAKARGTAAAPTAVLSGDFLGSNFAYGWAVSGGTGYVTTAGAGFIVVARDNYTATVAGTSFDIFATPTGTNGVARAAGFGAGVMIGSTTTDPGAGNLSVTGTIFTKAPITLAATSGTIGASDSSIIFNASGTFTATLPAAASPNTGRWLYVKSIVAQAINSASSNVVPRAGGAAGTALLASGAGNWAVLQSDGTNWVVMAGN